MSSAPSTRMPAWSSCCSSRSTGTFSTSANCATVTSAILLLLNLSFFREPVFAGIHDQFGGLLLVDAAHFHQLVDGEIGQILARLHALARESLAQCLPRQFEQIAGRFGALHPPFPPDLLS